MRVRNTIALIMGGMTLLVLAEGLPVGKIVSRAASLTSERNYAEAAALLIRWDIQRDLDALAFTTRDYAEWDWAWMFIESPADPVWNFEPEVSDRILLRNRFGLVAVCRKDGTLLLGKCLDLKTGEQQALPEDLPELLRKMVSSGQWQRPVKGFVRLDGQVWGWSSHPVTRTDRSAPHNGFLMFAKPAEQMLEEIKGSPLNVLIANLTLRRLDPDIGRSQQNVAVMRPEVTFPYRVYPAEEETGRMRVDLTLYGLDGQPVALVTTVTPGLFFLSNQHLWNRELTFGLLVGVALTAVLYGLLTRLVSAPLERLRSFIVGLDPARPVTERLSPGPGSEFRELAGSINQLLDTLETVRAEESRTRNQLQRREEQLRALFDQMVAGAALHEIIFDASGEPVDYRFLAVNQAFERLTGFRRKDVLGRTVREILPHFDSFWIRFYGETAKTGRSAETIHEEPELGRIYEVYAYSPELGKFVALFTDVTERVLQERQQQLLLKLTDRLNGARYYAEVLEALRHCFHQAFGDAETALYREREADIELLAGPGNEALETIVREIGQTAEDQCFREKDPAEALTAAASVAYRNSGTGERMVIAVHVPGMSRWDPWKQNLFRTACSLAGTTLARVMSEERIRRRLELEALATASSMRFIRGEPGKIREQIRHAIEDMGRFCEAGYISLELGLKNGQGSDFFRWSSREETAERAGAPVDLNRLSWLYARLREGKVVQIDGLDSLPEEASVERQLMMSWGWAAASIRMIPLMSEEGPEGLLTLVRDGWPDPEWLREDLPQLRILGDLILMAWQRARTIAAMQQRAISLLNPSADDGGYPLEVLFNSDELQRLLETFARAHNVHAVILDVEGNPFTRPVPSNEAELWPRILQLTRQISAQETGGRLCLCLMSGHVFWIAPIRADRTLLGYWVVGAEADRIAGLPEDIRTAEGPVWLNAEALAPDGFTAVGALVSQIAERLSTLALYNIRQAQLLARLTASEFLQQRLFTSVENAGDAILFCDGSGQVIYANRAADRMFDRWFSDLEGIRVFRPDELPDARLHCDVPVTRWFREPRRLAGEFDFAGANGRRRCVAFSLSPVEGSSENRTDWLVVC